MSDKELFDLAIAAYKRHCEENNLVYQQPNFAISRIDIKKVILRNLRGDLFKFYPKRK